MVDEGSAPRRGRRRQVNHAGGRQRVIQVRVSEAQDRVLRASAERAGMSVQRLMVTTALRGESAADMSERSELTDTLLRLLHAVASAGVNINQMAKATNATGELPENLDATIEWMRATVRRIDAAVDQVGVQ
ncbi:plasmid mobilization protein [Tomitella gaofuii]|uniref:plasmid mobilization protein n=1 Tax=Tomitella gaofuii TaxID=2760083 RepID=UPI0015F86EAA|nr:plasmid mobilization relaxosome protein MobC [Tomitella gaofuii]